MSSAEKIILAIGEPVLRRSIEGLLVDDGHEIVADVNSDHEVRALDPDVRASGVRVAVVYGDPSYDSGEFAHGKSITAELRAGIPEIYVIGLGTLSVPVFGDVNFELVDVGFASKMSQALQKLL